jgi:hypothetical protein
MASTPSTLEYCNDRQASEVARRNTYSRGGSAVHHINYQYQMTKYGPSTIETHGPPHDEYHPSHIEHQQPHDEYRPPHSESSKRTKHRRPSLSIRFGSFGWPHINISRRSSVISTPDSPSEMPSPPLPPMPNDGRNNNLGGRVIEDVGIPNHCLSIF